MKRILVICFWATLMSLALNSCSSKKSVAETLRDQPTEVSKSKSQKLAEDKPAIREWGEATNFNQSFAKTYAEGQARAAFRRKLETVISAASREGNDGATAYHSDGQEASIATDQGLLNDAFVTQIAEGVTKNLMVINTDTYQQSDGQYLCYVCVEYNGNIASMADAIASDAKKRVGQQVSDEERAKMEVRQEEFRKAVEEKLNKLQSQE